MEISLKSCTKEFWGMAEKYPEELICWVEERCLEYLNIPVFEEVFHHDLIMASYSMKSQFLSDSIEYIDQLPFITINPDVRYPTWRMSSDLGGIKAKTLLRFKDAFNEEKNFDYLLNSIAKLGQQNGLFCYSDPRLVSTAPKNAINSKAEDKALFSFVYQHYNTVWSFLLFFCLVKFEKRFPIIPFLSSFRNTKHFQKDIDLSNIKIALADVVGNIPSSIDVVIPTIGRPEFLKKVMEDLACQSHFPKRVIIVEQQPDIESPSEIENFLAKNWPFEIVHIFTHKTGACMARNMALEKVESEWIFFADDDIRLKKDILSTALKEARRLKLDCINLNCQQPGEETIFHKVKQWGGFGSGTSVVRSRFAKDLRFSEVFEHGYGEDTDFGMKLREKGCDIIYHPELVIRHLKAPVGGFRKKPVLAWEKEIPSPKPSPTIMMLAKRYNTPKQMKGFKISLYLKYFRNQNNKNPFSYLRNMEKNWKKSEEWADKLEKDSEIFGEK